MTKRSTSMNVFGLMILVLAFASSCKKEKDPDPAPGNPHVVNPPTPRLEDTISRKWKIENATHDGTTDYSSLGMEITMNKDGSYILHKTGYKGTWEFQDNKTKVLIDKAESQYKTVWTIVTLSSKNLKVTFKSPFTSGNAMWDMKAQ